MIIPKFSLVYWVVWDSVLAVRLFRYVKGGREEGVSRGEDGLVGLGESHQAEKNRYHGTPDKQKSSTL